jgi:hypothetical protein
MARKPRVAAHIHRYKRVDIGSFNKTFLVFRCTLPTCTHYVPLNMAEGKLCECNRCFKPMLITRAALYLALPHCAACTKRKDAKDVEAISEFLAKSGL